MDLQNLEALLPQVPNNPIVPPQPTLGQMRARLEALEYIPDGVVATNPLTLQDRLQALAALYINPHP